MEDIISRRGSSHHMDNSIDDIQLPDPKTTSILIGEVSQINSTVIKKFLEKLGYTQITQAENGVAAIAAAEQESFSIIFLDVRLPVIGGVEVTKRIRNYERGNGKPRATIVGLTAVYTDKDKMVGEDCGMDNMLKMPLHFSDLKRVLLQHAKPKKVEPLKTLILMYITNQPQIFQYNTRHQYSIFFKGKEVFLPSDVLDELNDMKESHPPQYRYPKFDDNDIEEILCIIPSDYVALKSGIVDAIEANDLAAVHRSANVLASLVKFVHHEAAVVARELSKCANINQAADHLKTLSLEMDSVWD